MHWLTDNWHSLFPYPWGSISLSILALICGGWVGIERQRKEKPAGTRTMALIALGSSTFTMVGYAFTSSTGDSGRVAAQIVTGIGFLGGGVLLRGPGTIQGTTTAATIWIVAAMGMSIGAGYAPAGIGLAIMIRGVLSFVGQWERILFGGRRTESLGVVFKPDNGKTEIKIDCLLDQFGILHAKEKPNDASEGHQRLVIEFRLSTRQTHEFLSLLVAVPEIVGIERENKDKG